MRPDQPPEPWHSFFVDIDEAFDQPIALQCIGGFAIAMLYGLPRPTVDVDFLSVVPADEIGRLDALAGMGSALHKKHGVYVQHVGIVTVPETMRTGWFRSFRPRIAKSISQDLKLTIWLFRSWNVTPGAIART